MSERGSFVTEYVYCSKCFEVVKSVLLGANKYLCSIVLPFHAEGYGDSGKDLPIVAGKIGGLYAGEELHVMEFELIPQLSKGICHKVRIAVLADNGERVFVAAPEKGQIDTSHQQPHGASGVAK